MSLKSQLQEMYHLYGSDVAIQYGLDDLDLSTYSWTFETNRWTHLLSCLLQQFADDQSAAIAEAVTALQFLDLTDVNRLASMSEAQGSHEDVVLATAVLRRYGFTPDGAESAIRVLAHTANVVKRTYGGKIQQFLRRQGQAMVDELTAALAHSDLQESQVQYAVTLWLQNVLNLPILLNHQAVLDFCKLHSCTTDDLIAAADELDLNIAVVDDLLTIQGWELGWKDNTEEARLPTDAKAQPTTMQEHRRSEADKGPK